ncbi:MAG: DUF2750 domain-containing protein [Saprospiraceae bacterium]
MTQQDIEKVFKKPGERRYDLFIKEIVKNEEVYGIVDDEGWTLLGDDNDTDILPLFHTAELANAFRIGQGYDDAQVGVLDAAELMDWLEDMESEGMMVAVVPNLHLNGAVVSANHLMNDLQEAFDKEEDR